MVKTTTSTYSSVLFDPIAGGFGKGTIWVVGTEHEMGPGQEPMTTGVWSEHLANGTLLADYHIESTVAQAGFSTVYRADDVRTGRTVAIKVLRKQLAQSAKGVARFQREFDALQGLRHPNIVEMIAHGELPDGRPYLVMEWISGPTLRDCMVEGRFKVEEVCAIAAQLGAALAASHDAGVVHRDLKLSNVMIIGGRSNPTVKLVDFGIAKPIDPAEAARTALTTTGQTLGTPFSMAPEQITGKPLDGRTDVYGMGVMLYELLTGVRPFTGTSAIEVAQKHLSQMPPPPSEVVPVDNAIDEVIMRCLAKKPSQRFATPKDVADALEESPGNDTIRQEAISANTVPAVGLHVQVSLSCEESELEDSAFENISTTVDGIRKACSELGLRVPLGDGRSFLAVASLPPDAPSAKALREKILACAAERLRKAEELFPADGKVRLTLHAHSAQAQTIFIGGATEFIGGDLFELDSWVAEAGGSHALFAGDSMLEELGEQVSSSPVTGKLYKRVLPS